MKSLMVLVLGGTHDIVIILCQSLVFDIIKIYSCNLQLFITRRHFNNKVETALAFVKKQSIHQIKQKYLFTFVG
jgi:hypothetical protein